MKYLDNYLAMQILNKVFTQLSKNKDPRIRQQLVGYRYNDIFKKLFSSCQYNVSLSCNER